MKYFSVFILCGLVVYLSGCAAMQLAEQKSKAITLVNSMSLTEASQYKELGGVNCDVNSLLFVDSVEDKCRHDMKVWAAYNFGDVDVVVVESIDHYKCPDIKDPSDRSCVQMSGRAYKKLPTAAQK